MGREIKFRAFITKPDGKETMFYFANLINTQEKNLMQYTGLKDKNDKDIYESDIVATSYGNGEVIWVRDGWSLHLPEYLGDPGALYWWVDKGISVIGNKYETTRASDY